MLEDKPGYWIFELSDFLKVIGDITFISAFESSPVHCLNPRPCENRRRPAKGGTIAMLSHIY
jgi:hypothetical protein